MWHCTCDVAGTLSLATAVTSAVRLVQLIAVVQCFALVLCLLLSLLLLLVLTAVFCNSLDGRRPVAVCMWLPSIAHRLCM
jgi:hypothetical protein